MLGEYEYIKKLVSDWQRAEETEEWDSFGEKYGEIDEVCDTLIAFIEKEIL